MLKSGKVTPLVGDIGLPKMGLTPTQIEELCRTIHSAANINLKASIATIFNDNIQASLNLAELAATSFGKLERFIYLSTVYVSSHLRSGTLAPEEVPSAIPKQISKKPSKLAKTLSNGYSSHVTPTYKPYPGFEIVTSSPGSGTVFDIFTSKSPVSIWASANKKEHNIIDEIPIDLVVNNILAHAAYGTRGVVHASTSCSAPMSLRQHLERVLEVMPADRLLEIAYTEDVRHPQLAPGSRLLGPCAHEYFFDDAKTRQLIEMMSEKDKTVNVDVRVIADRWAYIGCLLV
ncbi:hypothetical protein BC938DRAFT_478776 [Jimgerdemannia flammicorona]|uniref:Fatty acyl-CoA reductase n=1 Tax=Jimgerdemannia flammicorona TaxID=994334 RepID=A0A433QMD0_9FUNG|nr:hypothetical protein BC938DRAFT_478776 [Jimgerdemannia flammicorona]